MASQDDGGLRQGPPVGAARDRRVAARRPGRPPAVPAPAGRPPVRARRRRASSTAASTSPTRRGASWPPTAATPCSSATPSPATATPPARSPTATRSRGGGSRSSAPAGPSTPTRYFVVCANVLGGCQGTTGPASPAPRRRPARGAAASRWCRSATWCARRRRVADHLGVRRWATGHRRLDGRHAGARVGVRCTPSGSALARPHRHVRRRHRPADRLVVDRAGASSASTRSGAAATTTTPSPATGPHEGLALARMVSQITFRSDDVFTDRFGRDVVEPLQGGFELWQRFEVERYLEYHGDKLVRRFDANSYLLLTKAMDLHDVGRGPRRRRGRVRPHAGADAGHRRVERRALPELPVPGDRRPAPRPPASRAEYVEIDSAARPRRLPHRDRPGGRRPGRRSSPRWSDA